MEGDIVAIMHVLVLPPKESLNNLVNFIPDIVRYILIKNHSPHLKIIKK